MTKPILLITGGNGVLGTKIAQAALETYRVIATDRQPYSIMVPQSDFQYLSADITDQVQVQKMLEKCDPDLIIHTAAFTDVDKAEVERETCQAVNVLGTRYLVDRTRARLLYVSTDYVFDGTRGPYREEDTPNPLGWYGATKLEGETIVQRKRPDALICRTSTLYGFSPYISRFNFVGWLIRELAAGHRVRVAEDQFVSHTLADDLARTILFLAEQEVSGVYHTAGEERLSRYEFAARVCSFFDFDLRLLEPVPASQLGWNALRPLQGGLCLDKLHTLTTMMTTEYQLEIVRATFPWGTIGSPPHS